MIDTQCAGLPRNACAALGYGYAVPNWYEGIWMTSEDLDRQRVRFEAWKKRSVCMSVNDVCACEVAP